MMNFFRRLYKIVCFIFCAITFLVSCLMTFLYFVTDGSFENREESSLPVKFYISSDLIGIPVYGVLGIPLYSTDDELMYDGFHLKEYKTKFSSSDIHQNYKKFFQNRKCSRGKKGEKSYVYQCGETRFKVLVYKSNTTTKVAIYKDIKRN